MRMGLAGLCVAAGFGFAGEASAAVVAHYRFEPDAFLEDSSPNDLDLLNTTNATSSTDATTGGGAGSALFDGNDFLATEAPLDLTPYRHIRISWIQRLQSDQIGIVFEHSANWNIFNGSLLGIARGDILNSPVHGYAGIGLGGTYNLDTFPHPTAGVPGTWAAFSVEYDLDAGNAQGVTRVFDGNGNEIGTTVHMSMPTTFRNDFLYIGARAGGGAGFVGNIDELKIESVEIPEPASLALSGAGAALVLARRRR
jgi:hypothetical protein